MSFLNYGSLPSRFAPYGDSGILSRVAHSPYYKPPARPLGLLRQCLLHCQHVGLWSQASHYADNVVYGLWGLHPQPKWRRVSTFVDSTAAHSLARGTGCGRPLGDLEFGTYFPAG